MKETKMITEKYLFVYRSKWSESNLGEKAMLRLGCRETLFFEVGWTWLWQDQVRTAPVQRIQL